MRARAIPLVILLLAFCGSAFAQIKYTPESAAVWKMEEKYWVYRQANDEANFRTLWHDKAVGWPHNEAHPITTPALGSFSGGIGQFGRVVTYELTAEAVEVFGDVAITHYRVRYTTEKSGERSSHALRITHTWMKSGATWEIIGGMSAEMPLAK
jgi:ketosteroid isomerase-like protein